MKRARRELTDWHVTLRGARRLLLFRDDEDRQAFYGFLGDALRRTGAALHAQCLMSNHAHLGPRASSDQLSELMFRTELPYSRHHNRKYRLSGHTYDGPYFRKEVLSPRMLAFVSRYIHLNPVRAGLAARPERYPWSSAGQLLGDAEGPIRIDPLPTLRGFAPDVERARALYGDFVRRGLRRPRPMPVEGWSVQDLWQEEFLWILDAIGPPLAVPGSPTAKDLAAWIGIRAGIPPRAIGRALGAPDGRAVSRAVYALGQRLSRDPDLKSRILGLGILGSTNPASDKSSGLICPAGTA